MCYGRAMSIDVDMSAFWSMGFRVDELPEVTPEQMRMVRETIADAWLDSVALGVGFYREPIEALAARDPGQTTPPR